MSGTDPMEWVFIALSLPAILAFAWSLLQVQHDAEMQGLPHRLILALCALSWPIGVLVYWLARPPLAPQSGGTP
jgi:hypothetical protein